MAIKLKKQKNKQKNPPPKSVRQQGVPHAGVLTLIKGEKLVQWPYVGIELMLQGLEKVFLDSYIIMNELGKEWIES